jgi:serine/threonine protein kinase
MNIPSNFILPNNDERKSQIIVTNRGQIGEGGYGKVYKINYLGKPRALKVIDKKQFQGKNIDDVKSEINIIKYIEKAFPNCVNHILCYQDISEDENNIYLISDLMDTDYFDFIISKDYLKLPMNQKVEITYKVLMDLLDGLKILHSLGILHRDIKPENFLWNMNPPQIKIADFGLSCFIKDCKGKVGSLPYVSPFIYLSKENLWTTRDDLYSLATVIFSALTGRMYVDEEELIKAIQKDPDGYLKTIETAFKQNMTILKSKLAKSQENSAQENPKTQKLYLFLSNVLNPYNDHIWSVDEIKMMLE